MQESWDNTRAAELGSLFQLRDFGKAPGHPGPRRGATAASSAPDGPTGEDLSTGYVAEKSDFVLGYLMAGVANQQIAAETGDDSRAQEAADYFREAARLRPALAGLIDELRAGRYNTLLVVDYGRGPRKA